MRNYIIIRYLILRNKCTIDFEYYDTKFFYPKKCFGKWDITEVGLRQR